MYVGASDVTVRPPSDEHFSLIVRFYKKYCVTLADPAETVTVYQISYVPKIAPPAVSVITINLFSVLEIVKSESGISVLVDSLCFQYLKNTV